jgi:hypothetical protein
MNRRNFLKGAIVTAAAIASTKVVGDQRVNDTQLFDNCYSDVSINSIPSINVNDEVYVWIDVEKGMPGSDVGLNGTSINPVNNLKDAEILMSKLRIAKLKKIG